MQRQIHKRRVLYNQIALDLLLETILGSARGSRRMIQQAATGNSAQQLSQVKQR